MKIQKKIFAISILSISILFGLLVIQSDAINETNKTNQVNNAIKQNTYNTATNKNQNVNNTTNNTIATKSSNANLSNLGITPHDFTGFKPGTTSYKVTVPKDTESVEVYAKAQHAKATVTGTGKKNLQEGDNKLEVIVTAEDGSKKTYNININRGAEKKSGNTEESIEDANGLLSLKINDLNLLPEFKTNIYEYTVKYIGEDTRLNIEMKPTDEDYNVEVIGNEDLQEGENVITILVSERNGENVATYQITVNKSLIDEEAIAREEAERKAKQQKTIIGTVVAVIILFAIILFLVIRNRRNKNIAEEYSGVSLYGKSHKSDEKEKEELPKALKEKKEERIDTQEVEQNSKEEQEDDEESIENMPKEKLKEKFLNNYSNYEEEYEENNKETKKKEKHKGKRFKE